ncbi:Apolipoprotein N-acyltransferase [Luteitalea pratensis]|uniref:Apolipoprotein N-acyltransferase n=1 Tax=Luteitalea pratensis TaxID=1855912 RepID=A0A143PRK8_LUTPR|nr:apolipoprotein N-acyltransferase [Luteitalea pratensis]AMY11232.1 Apolipoprotein N-acyltransferase [Luteitalea pratensis]
MLFALSMPRPALAPLGWVALAPLCVAVARCANRPAPRGPRPFLLGLVTGLAAFAGTVAWTSDVLAIFGGLNAALAWGLAGLLIAYLAVYPALFSMALTTAVVRAGVPALAIAPMLWVGTEWLRGTLFTGFPWVLLGYSQSDTEAPLQVASLAGIYGLSGLVACPSAAIALLMTPDPRRSRTRLWAATLLMALPIAVSAWGAWRVAREALLQGPAVRVALVQGNVPQGQKWDPAYRDEILARYLALTRDAARQGVDLVIWPESSTPFVFGRDGIQTEVMRAAMQQARVSVVFGSDEVVGPKEFYNAAFVMDGTGEIRGSYRKMQLVPFGEYIPVRWLLFFAQPLVEGFSDFSAGQQLTLLPVGVHRLSVAVCYEAVFPWLSRRAVRQGSQLLATITNDAWYGTSAAPYQHFQQARVRAVETGRYLVRAANTGISAVVDPYGRVQVQSPLFETGTWTGDVRWLDGSTWYVRTGDAGAWACMLVTGMLILLPLWERVGRRGSTVNH